MRLLLISVVLLDVNKEAPYDVCPIVKQYRLPFQLKTISISVPFELIHVDTGELYPTKFRTLVYLDCG